MTPGREDPGARGRSEADPASPASGAADDRASGSVRGLVAASAAVVALALAAGLHPGEHWLTELLVAAAMGQGVLAGATWRRFWRGPLREELFGAGGRYAGFLAAVAFSAVEAYAVGAGVGREDAPGPVVAIMLAPPLVAAAVALRSAVRRRREREPGGGAAAGTRGAAGGGPSRETRTAERSEGAGS